MSWGEIESASRSAARDYGGRTNAGYSGAANLGGLGAGQWGNMGGTLGQGNTGLAAGLWGTAAATDETKKTEESSFNWKTPLMLTLFNPTLGLGYLGYQGVKYLMDKVSSGGFTTDTGGMPLTDAEVGLQRTNLAAAQGYNPSMIDAGGNQINLAALMPQYSPTPEQQLMANMGSFSAG